jgi:hypothetical protein
MTNAFPKENVIPFVALPLADCRNISSPVSSAGRLLLESLNQLTLSLTGRPATFLAYHPPKRLLFHLHNPVQGNPVGSKLQSFHLAQPARIWDQWTSSVFPRRKWTDYFASCSVIPSTMPMASMVAVFMSGSFLILEQPSIEKLALAALTKGLACCGNQTTGDLYAFAVRCQGEYEEELHRLLRWLTLTDTKELCVSPAMLVDLDLPPAAAGPWNSPAMNASAGWRGFRTNDAPPYVNAALEETCFTLGSSSGGVDTEDSFIADLIALRSRSRVPWVFNELLNEMDYRMGTVNPVSIPVEFHISATGNCNIECRFCSHTNGNDFKDCLSLNDLCKLDFWDWIRTLRLTSGNGEPTLNKNLMEIIRWIHRQYSHLGMNFFTNGILLDLNELMPALIEGLVLWINISLNAATRKSWRELCQADYFDRICGNLKRLRDLKHEMKIGNPAVYASMVLTSETVRELPFMPEICRELGIDRFVAIPFFALGYNVPDKFDEKQAYHHAAGIYDDLYDQAIKNAAANGISIELPLPTGQKSSDFAVETRILHDYAAIERNEWQLGKLLCSRRFSNPQGSFCHFLWRYASVTSSLAGPPGEVQRWLYPCLGPLASVMTTKEMFFHFPDRIEFEKLWQNEIFTFLRKSQHISGLCTICDFCRQRDTRQPHAIHKLKGMIKDFALPHSL